MRPSSPPEPTKDEKKKLQQELNSSIERGLLKFGADARVKNLTMSRNGHCGSAPGAQSEGHGEAGGDHGCNRGGGCGAFQVRKNASSKSSAQPWARSWAEVY